MKKFIALGTAVVGGVIVFRAFPPMRHRLTAAISRRMLRHMKQMMARLPDNAPPKLIMTVLPRLRDQNDEIIAMLREQNELLRKYPYMAVESALRQS